MSTSIAVALIAGPVVVAVVVRQIWARRKNRQRAQAVKDIEVRHTSRAGAPLRHGSRSGERGQAGRPGAPAYAAYDAPAPMPVPADSWPSAPPESHGHSFTGGGGSFDGAGASGDWAGSSSDSSSSYSSSDGGGSSSVGGSSGGSD